MIWFKQDESNHFQNKKNFLGEYDDVVQYNYLWGKDEFSLTILSNIMILLRYKTKEDSWKS